MTLKTIKGKTIISSGPEHETILPIDLPAQSFEGVKDIERSRTRTFVHSYIAADNRGGDR